MEKVLWDYCDAHTWGDLTFLDLGSAKGTDVCVTRFNPVAVMAFAGTVTVKNVPKSFHIATVLGVDFYVHGSGYDKLTSEVVHPAWLVQTVAKADQANVEIVTETCHLKLDALTLWPRRPMTVGENGGDVLGAAASPSPPNGDAHGNIAVVVQVPLLKPVERVHNAVCDKGKPFVLKRYVPKSVAKAAAKPKPKPAAAKAKAAAAAAAAEDDGPDVSKVAGPSGVAIAARLHALAQGDDVPQQSIVRRRANASAAAAAAGPGAAKHLLK